MCVHYLRVVGVLSVVWECVFLCAVQVGVFFVCVWRSVLFFLYVCLFVVMCLCIRLPLCGMCLCVVSGLCQSLCVCLYMCVYFVYD